MIGGVTPCREKKTMFSARNSDVYTQTLIFEVGVGAARTVNVRDACLSSGRAGTEHSFICITARSSPPFCPLFPVFRVPFAANTSIPPLSTATPLSTPTPSHRASPARRVEPRVGSGYGLPVARSLPILPSPPGRTPYHRAIPSNTRCHCHTGVGREERREQSTTGRAGACTPPAPLGLTYAWLRSWHCGAYSLNATLPF